MSHLYLHIPFCKQACHYCDFHFSTTGTYRSELIEAMLDEMALHRNTIQSPVKTIYFGGGTPSLLTDRELQSIFVQIEKLFGWNDNAEVTLEANPDDLNEAYLKMLRHYPVNRLSIGVQSFRDEDLRFMNRAHVAAQSESAIKRAQDLGFENLSIDLIYGTPGLNDEQWKQQVQRAIAFDVPHISSYCLTVEPKTPLDAFVKKGKVPPVDEQRAEAQFQILSDTLTDAGYEHYEISNLALPGYRAVHNSAYWAGVPYLGIGPSAHSFTGSARRWNVANNVRYLQAITNNNRAYEEEILTPENIINEYIMTSLRLIDGLHLPTFETRFGSNARVQLLNEAAELMHRGQLIVNGEYLRIVGESRFLADGIAAALFR